MGSAPPETWLDAASSSALQIETTLALGKLSLFILLENKTTENSI